MKKESALDRILLLAKQSYNRADDTERRPRAEQAAKRKVYETKSCEQRMKRGTETSGGNEG